MHERRQISRTGARGVRGGLVALVAGVTVTSALAACSPSSDGSGADTPDPSVTVGPLDALLDTVSPDGGEMSQAKVELMEQGEETISACMAAQGFEYVPTDWRARAQAQSGRERDGAADAEDPVAFAQEHGYGIFTEEAVTAAMAAPGPAADDPNAERLAAMSPTEQEAWYLALWGPGQSEEYDAGTEPYDWTKYGCGGQAAHETGTDSVTVFDDSAWQGLRDQITALKETVLTHGDLADAQAAWATCMEDAGHPGYASVDEPAEELTRRAEEIWSEAGQVVEVAVGGGSQTDPAYLQVQEEIAARSAEMLQVETELAAADYRCRAESGYAERVAQVWIALQEEFYAAHRTDLDAWLAAYEEYQAGDD